MNKKTADRRDTVLGKATMILRAFGGDDGELSLADLVERTGLHKATVHRLALELSHHRLLDKAGNTYRVGRGLFELGMLANCERRLVDTAMPFLHDVQGLTRETVHLAVRDGEDAVYVAKLGRHEAPTVPSRTGGRLPLYCTALGKVLLAHSPESVQAGVLRDTLPRRTSRTVVAPGILRRQLVTTSRTGVAFEYEESVAGLQCVAVPILTAEGVVAALSVAGPIHGFQPERHITALKAFATKIGQALR